MRTKLFLSLSLVLSFFIAACSKPEAPAQGIPYKISDPIPVTYLQAVSPLDPEKFNSITFNFQCDLKNCRFLCQLDNNLPEKCSPPVLIDKIPIGKHSFSVISTSDKDVTDHQGASYSWEVKELPPTVVIGDVTPASKTTNLRTISIPFTASKEINTPFACSVDFQPFSICSSPVSLSGLGDGIHQVSIAISDLSGGINPASVASYAWTVDTVPPIALINKVSPNVQLTNQTSIDIYYIASKLSTFECSLDNAVFGPCVAPSKLTGLMDGTHTFKVRATDLAGNNSSDVSYSWTIDTTLPVVSIVAQYPANGFLSTNKTDNSISFTANKPSTFVCSFDLGDFAPCTSPFLLSNLGDGNHFFKVIATDQQGKVSPTSQFNWTVDTLAPQTRVVSAIPTGPFINSANILINFAANKAVTQTVCSLDGGPFSVCSSPVSYNFLNQGAHSVSFKSTDGSGNVESPAAQYSFTVDTAPPIVTLQTMPKPIAPFGPQTFTFSANKSDVTFTCSVDGVPEACTSPYVKFGLQTGVHSFSIQGKDRAGNLSPPVSYNWKVDALPPSIAMSCSQNLNDATQSAGLNVSCSLNSNKVVTFKYKLDSGAYSDVTATFNVSVTPGSHILQAIAIDQAGNQSPTPAVFEFEAYQEVSAVITTASPAGPYINSPAPVVSFTAPSPISSFVCSIDGAIPPVPCSSPFALPSLSDGAHSFSVRAVGDHYIDPFGATLNFTVDTISPSILTQSVTEKSSSITFNWTTDELTTTEIEFGMDQNSLSKISGSVLLTTDHSLTVPSLPQTKFFTYSASGQSYVVPDGVTSVKFIASGGGGGGGGCTINGISGGGGGSGPIDQTVSVTPGQVISIQPGMRGSGGCNGNPGTQGGTTTIGILLSVLGGHPGSNGSGNSVTIGAGENGGGNGGGTCWDGAAYALCASKNSQNVDHGGLGGSSSGLGAGGGGGGIGVGGLGVDGEQGKSGELGSGGGGCSSFIGCGGDGGDGAVVAIPSVTYFYKLGGKDKAQNPLISSIGQTKTLSWPLGKNGDYAVHAGETKVLKAGAVYDFNNLLIEEGGRLVVDQSSSWTFIGVAGTAQIDGTIEASNGQHSGGSFTTKAPDEIGSLNGETLSYTIVQRSGGKGEGGNPGLYGVCGGGAGYCPNPSSGGLSASGNGGGGGGGGSAFTGAQGSSGSAALFYLSGGGGAAASGPGGASGVSVYGANGNSGIGGSGGNPGSGGSGGFRGAHGQGIYLKFMNGASGSGTITAAGKSGGNGGTGGSGSCAGACGGNAGSGGGGAGGSGGMVVVKYRGSLSNNINIIVSGGAAGTTPSTAMANGTAATAGDNGSISISTF